MLHSVAPHFDILHASFINFAHESGFRHFVKIPKLNEEHKLKYFEYFNKYFLENLDKLIFTDESAVQIFKVNGHTKAIFIWKN